MKAHGTNIFGELQSGPDLSRMPTLSEIEGIFRLSQIAQNPTSELYETYCDRTVLVTGAAGSIGSELVRQLCTLNVSRLLLLDYAENSLFELERELREQVSVTEIISILGNIGDQIRLQEIFSRYTPHGVLHSAAYKHVPMAEAHPSEAFLNNVIGTRNVLNCAIEFGCERFVLISTDKAVNPSSVMGATKRIGEMLVQKRGQELSATALASVRFGNVIGSRGSVIPIFLKQIAERRAITLTDERMSRYFITVGQAVELVLKASTLASKGEIYILEMGDPVMIATLAGKLIELCGLTPEEIPVQIVGARPGEKIREELWSAASCVTKTGLPGILRIDEDEITPEFENYLQELEELARAFLDDELRERLHSVGRSNQDAFTTSAGKD
jgi:FlaA1/EpsC-like NDP-sugar epimerase